MLAKWFREYLSFHRSERNGVIALCIALLLLIGYNIYQRVFWKSKYEEIQLEFGEEILTFTEKQDSIQTSTRASNQPWLPKAIEYFNFDPNTVDSSGWIQLGFSPKQSAAILKYRNAGAVFRKPEDVKKLFVVDEQKYVELEPYIKIEPIPDNTKPFKQSESFKPTGEKKFEMVIVEINSADTAQLQNLYGIGSSFAKRIVKYRDLLGGYISKEQVLEVYGMDSVRYAPISESLLVDTTYRVRININSADFKTLLRHPYLNKNQVKAIVNYRKQHGSFQSVEGLQRIHLLKGEPYRKIAPYLTVQ